MEQIFATLATQDPKKETICVGGAAMAVQIETAGGHMEVQADVDVLCSGVFFTEACKTGPFRKDLQKFCIRWPYGTAGRALAPVVDFYSASKHFLPFSATMALGGDWYPTTYEKLKYSILTTKIQDHLFLEIGEVLRWTAVTGREKYPLRYYARVKDS